MNKTEIMGILNEFPYSRGDYWIVAGGAMVLHGIKEQTNDIDLGCNKKMADALEQSGFLYKYTESGNRHFKYGEHIEIFENWFGDSVESADGFQVITIGELIEMKRELGREKDNKDIRLIDEFLKKKNNGTQRENQT